MELMDKIKIFLIVFVSLVVLIAFIISIFPITFIKTTENGQHTGIVTAVETNGAIWKTDRVYFKTDVQSSQEDAYCVIDPAVKKALENFQISKEVVTIYYDNYLIVGYSLCKSEGAIIVGVQAVK